MATVLIIYYKQISEGYDDKDRYQIMQKVGMSKKEVKGSIHSQILTVFFVPLLMAILHVTVAFKPITKLLLVFNLSDTHLSMMCTIGVSAVFAVFYVIVFAITSREYYKNRKNKKEQVAVNPLCMDFTAACSFWLIVLQCRKA